MQTKTHQNHWSVRWELEKYVFLELHIFTFSLKCLGKLIFFVFSLISWIGYDMKFYWYSQIVNFNPQTECFNKKSHFKLCKNWKFSLLRKYWFCELNFEIFEYARKLHTIIYSYDQNGISRIQFMKSEWNFAELTKRKSATRSTIGISRNV